MSARWLIETFLHFMMPFASAPDYSTLKWNNDKRSPKQQWTSSVWWCNFWVDYNHVNGPPTCRLDFSLFHSLLRLSYSGEWLGVFLRCKIDIERKWVTSLWENTTQNQELKLAVKMKRRFASRGTEKCDQSPPHSFVFVLLHAPLPFLTAIRDDLILKCCVRFCFQVSRRKTKMHNKTEKQMRQKNIKNFMHDRGKFSTAQRIICWSLSILKDAKARIGIRWGDNLWACWHYVWRRIYWVLAIEKKYGTSALRLWVSERVSESSELGEQKTKYGNSNGHIELHDNQRVELSWAGEVKLSSRWTFVSLSWISWSMPLVCECSSNEKKMLQVAVIEMEKNERRKKKVHEWNSIQKFLNSITTLRFSRSRHLDTNDQLFFISRNQRQLRVEFQWNKIVYWNILSLIFQKSFKVIFKRQTSEIQQIWVEWK